MPFFDLTTPGLSLWSIPTAFVIAFYPHIVKHTLIEKTIGLNTVQPRSNLERLSADDKHKEVHARAARLVGAHQNGYEVLPLWIGAVLSAHVAGLDPATINAVSASFILLRLLYNYVYINGTTPTFASIRTTLFFTGLAAPFYLLIKSGLALNARA